MGDLIQKILEEMIPELEDLQKKGLFSKTEVKSIVRKRTDFEYKIKARVPKLNDFLRYVQYEMNLELLRTKRKNKFENMKPSSSDHSSTRRVCFIFERALRRFGDVVSLWLQYIEYCRRSGSSKRLDKVFPKAVQSHPLVPKLWLRAAQFEFEDNNHVEAARVFLQRGLRMVPGSRELWLYMIEMELRYINRLRERKTRLGLMAMKAPKVAPGDEPEADGEADAAAEDEGNLSLQTATEDALDDTDKRFLSGVLPQAIFANAVKSKELQDDYQFRFDVLRLIRVPPPPVEAGTMEPPEVAVQRRMWADMVPLRTFILDSIAEGFAGVELVWDLRARQAATDQAQSRGAPAKAKTGKKGGDAGADVAEKAALAVFEEAISSAAMSESPKMWRLYATYLHECQCKFQRQGQAASACFMRTRLLDVLGKAVEEDLADEEMATLYVTVLLQGGRRGEAQAVLGRVMTDQRFLASETLWALKTFFARELFLAGDEPSKKSRKKSVQASPSVGGGFQGLAAVYEEALASLPAASRGSVVASLLETHTSRLAAACLDVADGRGTTGTLVSVYRGVHGAFRQAIGATVAADRDQFRCRYADWVLNTVLGNEFELVWADKQAKKALRKKRKHASSHAGDTTRVKEVRDVLEWLLASPGTTLDLFMHCIQVEQAVATVLVEAEQEESSAVRLTKLFEKAIGAHADATPLWLAYITHELNSKDFKKVSSLHRRAVQALPPSAQADFMAQYQAMNLSC